MRRSRRKLYNPVQDAIEHCRRGKDKEGFIKRFVNVTTGYGLFTTKQFSKGEFLLEYVGEHISTEEGEKREDDYPESMGNFLFFFGKEKCVDATHYPNRLCRFVNDRPGDQANSVMKMVKVDGMQRLCLFARNDIGSDTELCYDYGVKNLPWRNTLVTNDSSSDLTECSCERDISITKKKIGDVEEVCNNTSVTENEAGRKEFATNMDRHNVPVDVLIETNPPDATVLPCKTHQEVLVLENKHSDIDELCINAIKKQKESEAGTKILDTNKDGYEVPVDVLIETYRVDASPRPCETNQDDARPNIFSSMSHSDTSSNELKEVEGVHDLPEVATEREVSVLGEKNSDVRELCASTNKGIYKDGCKVPADVLGETTRQGATSRPCETNQDDARSNICSSKSHSLTYSNELSGLVEVVHNMSDCANEREGLVLKKKSSDIDESSSNITKETLWPTESEAGAKLLDVNKDGHEVPVDLPIDSYGPDPTPGLCGEANQDSARPNTSIHPSGSAGRKSGEGVHDLPEVATEREVSVLGKKNSDVRELCASTNKETNKDGCKVPADVLGETTRQDATSRPCETNQDDARSNKCSSKSHSLTYSNELSGLVEVVHNLSDCANEKEGFLLEKKSSDVDEPSSNITKETFGPTESEAGAKLLDVNKDGHEVPVDLSIDSYGPDPTPGLCGEAIQDSARPNTSIHPPGSAGRKSGEGVHDLPEVATEREVSVLGKKNSDVLELCASTNKETNKDGCKVPADVLGETTRQDATSRPCETNQDDARSNTCSSKSHSLTYSNELSGLLVEVVHNLSDCANEREGLLLEKKSSDVDESSSDITKETLGLTESEAGAKLLDVNKDGHEVPVDLSIDSYGPDPTPGLCGEANQDSARPNTSIHPSCSAGRKSGEGVHDLPEVETEREVSVPGKKNSDVRELCASTNKETNKDGCQVPADVLGETTRQDATSRPCETNQDDARSNVFSYKSHSLTNSNELSGLVEVVHNLSDCANEREGLVLEKKSSDVDESSSNTSKETLGPTESEAGAKLLDVNKDGHEVPVDLSIDSYGTDPTPGLCGEGNRDSARPNTSIHPPGSARRKSGERHMPGSSSSGLPNFKKAMMQLRPRRNYPQYREEEEHVSGSCDSDSDVNDPTYRYRYIGTSDEDERSDSEPGVQTHIIDSTTGRVNDRTDTLSNSDAELGTERANTVFSSKKPRRRCPFCDVYQTNLSRHIRLKHKNLKEVADAVAAPEEERSKLFNGFKKEGILKENQDQAKLENPQYQQEKKSRTGSGKLVMCSNCRGFYHAKFIARHKKLCLVDTCEPSVSIPLSLLSKIDESSYADEFLQDVLCKMRDDDIGKIAKKDPVIVMAGKRMYMKNKVKADKKNEVRKSVMTSMRRLATLYAAFNDTEEELGPSKREEGTSADMFKRCNYNHLEQAVISCTLRGDGNSTDDLKHGLKSALYYLIKRTCTILKGTYLVDENDNKAEDVDKFLKVFELNHDFLFGDAAYAMAKKRNETLRRPAEMPIEEDVRKVREYTISRLTEITKDSFNFLNYHLFVELRDLLVCRLTLFNARRGGEPSRLRLTEWLDAENNVWIDPNEVEKLDDPLDKALAGKMKIAYQTGKGNKHLVPVLIPPDTVEAMKMIAKKESRDAAEIVESNPYMFPSTQQSHFHVSGWHAVHNVTEKITLEKGYLLTATKNRHRVSTMYAVMDIPEEERRYFYDHMGHSKEINADIYQAPLALMELVKVGRSLKHIDGLDSDDHEENLGSPPSSTRKDQITQGVDNDDGEEDWDSPTSSETRKRQITQGIDNDDGEEDWDSPTPSETRKRRITQGPDNDEHEEDLDCPPSSTTKKCQTTQGIDNDDGEEDWDSPTPSETRKRRITQGPDNDEHEEDLDCPPSSTTKKCQTTQGIDNDDGEEDWDSPTPSETRKRRITQGPDNDEHEEDLDCPPSSTTKKCQTTQDKTRLSEKKRKERKYIKWNQKDEAIVLSHFEGFIMNKESKKLPGRKDIQRFLKKTPEIGQQYNWMTIRTKVMNEKVKRERHCKERLSSMQVM